MCRNFAIFSCHVFINIFLANFSDWPFEQDGSKVLVKGNICSDSHDSLPKAQTK